MISKDFAPGPFTPDPWVPRPQQQRHENVKRIQGKPRRRAALGSGAGASGRLSEEPMMVLGGGLREI